MRSKPVYMFHAIGTEDQIAGADPHYAYSVSDYGLCLSKLGNVGSLKDTLSSKLDKPIFTFDDGHASNYEAARILKFEFDGRADFFINPSTVNKPNYLTWSQIREMHDWGMSIQSHSYDHVYLSDLDRIAQKEQLSSSKKAIEDEISDEVAILAPPGGRYNQDTLSLLSELGYQHISISQPGRWSGASISPRIPVLRHTQVDDLVGCNRMFSRYLLKQVIKYRVTGLAKKALGNQSYDLLRAKLLGVDG